MAVTMVYFKHSGRVFLGAKSAEQVNQLDLVGYCGVVLFFALSGFLIGQILIRDMGGEPEARDVKRFWTRRWLRTLPVYYLFLGINLVIHWGMVHGHMTLRYATFTQNLINRDRESSYFFSESWSLTIEEWFYLLLPLTIFGVSWLARKTRASVLWSAVILGGVSASLRFYYAIKHPEDSWRSELRTIAVFGMDGLMMGVLAAYLKTHFHEAWTAKKFHSLALGLFCLLIVFTSQPSEGNSPALQVGFLSLCSLSFVLLLPAFASWRVIPRPWSRAVVAISLWSYPLYLIQNPLIFVSGQIFPVSGTGTHPWRFVAVWVLSCFAAFLIHEVLEKPVLAFRERRFPSFAKEKRPEEPVDLPMAA